MSSFLSIYIRILVAIIGIQSFVTLFAAAVTPLQVAQNLLVDCVGAGVVAAGISWFSASVGTFFSSLLFGFNSRPQGRAVIVADLEKCAFLTSKRRYQEALCAIDAALLKFPEDSEALYRKANCLLLADGQTEAAFTLLRQAMAIDNPPYSLWAQERLASELQKRALSTPGRVSE